MSFEGYYRRLCASGHQSVMDVWDEIEQCRCGAAFVWSRLVDETNGEGYDPPLDVATEAITERCNLGHDHVLVEATYRKPEGL